MTQRWVGLVAGGDAVTVVDAKVPAVAEEPITILLDDTWHLQKGDRPSAYSVLHQRARDYLQENRIERAFIKASALSTGPTKLAHLTSAEVRGVVIAAAASVCKVQLLSNGVISRTYGERKVDEYVQDDSFWDENTIGGRLRKSSREAVMLLVATRAN